MSGPEDHLAGSGTAKPFCRRVVGYLQQNHPEHPNMEHLKSPEMNSDKADLLWLIIVAYFLSYLPESGGQVLHGLIQLKVAARMNVTSCVKIPHSIITLRIAHHKSTNHT